MLGIRSKFLSKLILITGIIVVGAVLAAFVPPIYSWYLKPDPKAENFVGMTRMEVVEWLDKNGRAHDMYLEADENEGRIVIYIDSGFEYYEAKDKLVADIFAMEQPIWEVGFKKVSDARLFRSILKFENDKVIFQYNGSYLSE